MSFADPYRTVPEVARLLRPGGLFAFNHEAPLASICWPAGEDHLSQTLALDYFGLHRLEDGQISFQLPHGEWIRLFRSNGLVVEDLIELRPADDAASTYRDPEDLAWSRRWPAEEIWRLRRA